MIGSERMALKLTILNNQTDRGKQNEGRKSRKFENGETNNDNEYIQNNIGLTEILQIFEQPLHVQGNAIRNQTLINIFCNSNGANNAANRNESCDYNNQLHRRYPSPSPEQGVSKEYDLDSDRITEMFRGHNQHRNERD
ncbi:MAG: hypothetical protein EZS28_022874 [Streblomastix strix]|uniref:Uncharacterized protein n=1 Tax=Streblomastix strix TaxID=222440 RepID=A0A5J4VG99_9EUKA|nr:MAG: hypothetical protein EZS28_022874 [Streblomastix strix]